MKLQFDSNIRRESRVARLFRHAAAIYEIFAYLTDHQFQSTVQCFANDVDWISSYPTRSAIVRASFKIP